MENLCRTCKNNVGKCVLEENRCCTSAYEKYVCNMSVIIEDIRPQLMNNFSKNNNKKDAFVN